MPAAQTYEPIATTTLGSATNSITFSSISQSFTDLVLVCTGTANTASSFDIQVGNGSVDTGANYSITLLAGDGSSASTYRESNTPACQQMGIVYTTPMNSTIHFMNYCNESGSTYKGLLSRNNNLGFRGVATTAGLWRNTSAINIIKISTGGANMATGFTATLYGIKAA
ncbi:MAG: hypothetical protein ACR2IJ_02510 [Fluviibacter sp.]